MSTCTQHLRLLILALAVTLLSAHIVVAAEPEVSSFGQIAIPSPAKPANADQCVEPVEVMRRDHMKFLMHQRDDTVIDGDRGARYSLVGCMNCHNPAGTESTVVRYENPKHFCAECHLYASVKIDCFECHADRGLENSQQSQLSMILGETGLSMQTFRLRQGPRSAE